MRRFATLAAVFLVASGASAQTPGSCALGTAEGDLNISGVFARVFNTGSLFFGNTTTNGDGYLVPKASANSPLFAAGLWVGGRVGGEVRAAGARYTNFTFWPGPLGDGAVLPNASSCSAFDRIYTVDVIDLRDYESGIRTSPDLAEWPVGLGAPAIDASGQPLAVTSRDQTLDLDAGERPVIVGNGETAFWVMNDVGRYHTAMDSAPLGIEVRVTAFSISSTDAGVNFATFYRYQIVNRGSSQITDMRAGFFADPDLGDSNDDYLGADSTRGMLYVYNRNDSDAAYGSQPPALGFDILSGAASAGYFVGSGVGQNDPSSAGDYLNYLRGVWKDGSPIRVGGTGYDPGGSAPVTAWAFSGDPVTTGFWSEENTDQQGTRSPSGDRRGHIAADISTLAPGESAFVDLAILFAQGTNRLDSVTRLRAVSDAIQSSYDAGMLYPQAVARERPPEASGVALTLAPNPARGDATVRLTLEEASGVRVRVVDALGREVARLADEPRAAGEHTWSLPARLSVGVYAVEVVTDEQRVSARWTVVR